MLERALVAFSLLGASWVLWLLVLLSILSVAVMIERLLFYMKRQIDVGPVLKALGDHLDKRDIAGAKALFIGDTMEGHVLRTGLGLMDRGAKFVSESMEAELVNQKARFDAYLIFLGTLGNNAPFIGLMGTVLGIIKAFKDLSLGDPTKG